jgi:hypothetical protein
VTDRFKEEAESGFVAFREVKAYGLGGSRFAWQEISATNAARVVFLA